MTDVTKSQDREQPELSAADEQLLRELTERARAGGLKLTGEGALLGKLTKMVVEGALEGELDDHLGYGKHDPAGRDGGNSRNGHRAKTVLTEAGPVELSVPRDRDASFEPKIVARRQRRLTGVEEMVISLSAKGLTHGEIAAHLAEVYGAEVSKQTITTITDAVMEGMAEWQSRPLDPVYAVVFIDAINVKIREGQIANRPIYLALGVTVDGERDILGLWAGEHGAGEGAKYWLRVLSEIKNRGVRDVCLLVCDGLKGLPDAVSAVWEKTIVQTCIVHLLRNSFKYASKRDWAQLAKDLKPIYTAASEAEALDRFAEFSGKWENSPGPGLTTSRRRARNVETGRRRWAYRLRIIVVSPWLAELARLPGVGMRHLARDERADLAAFLTTLSPEQWQAPTLCARWRVRDVVAHVVSYDELDMYGLLAKAVRGRFWSRRVNALAMAPYRTRSPEQLLALLTAHLQPRGLPAALGGRVALTEGLIHHQDIRRALGAPRAIPPERLLPVLRIALIAPDIGGLWHYRGLRLVATDLGFSAGIGSEVRGTAEALLMTMAGRRGVVSELSGPGQPKLARHLDR